jgi:two-component system, OmpR family, alkaline phosphatase synthesis response regulator PhoP
MPPKVRILVVEDDGDLAELICLHLADCGYQTTRAADGRTALDTARAGGFDLVILDVMLPYLDGFEICQQLRETDAHVPILMLTARGEEADRVKGLEIGADDYLTKPFSVRELQARVRALLRRASVGPPADDEEIRCGDLLLVPARRAASLAGQQLVLTTTEFDLLELFARNPGRAFSRMDLLEEVWGYRHDGYSHTVNTHINRLRTKLGDDPASPRFIRTIWGHGYSFVHPGADLE